MAPGWKWQIFGVFVIGTLPAILLGNDRDRLMGILDNRARHDQRYAALPEVLEGAQPLEQKGITWPLQSLFSQSATGT
jgi:hypothetical protein